MLINSYSKDNPNYYIQKNIINNTNIEVSFQLITMDLTLKKLIRLSIILNMRVSSKRERKRRYPPLKL